MVKIAIFASGSGTNAENLTNHFSKSHVAKVVQVYCNRQGAYVIERAKKLNIPSKIVKNKDLSGADFQNELANFNFIILAGFLAKIPENLILNFPDRIINIHPSLLPKYGGKGMYGSHVHEAVIENKERQSGITIHLVNQNYDEGQILFQASFDIDQKDDAHKLASKIHSLEQKYFPQVVEDYIRDTLTQKSING
ncbi:MAG: phosphoribosylglycinamide formyltransferase [Cyclobacteriaceae bacterium]